MSYLSYDEKKEIKEKIKELKKLDLKEKQMDQESIERILEEIYDFRNHGKEDKSEIEKRNKNYPYIPFSRKLFTEMILVLQRKYHKKSFVDVGCGIGDKVILAELFGDFDSVTGIELNTTTYYVAKYFCLVGEFPFQEFEDYFKPRERLKKGQKFHPLEAKVKREIINIDAFKYDFSKHDFIYMYSPISDNSVLEKLYIKILKEIPKGGILLEVLHPHRIVDIIEQKFKNVKLTNYLNFKYSNLFIIKRTEKGYSLHDITF